MQGLLPHSLLRGSLWTVGYRKDHYKDANWLALPRLAANATTALLTVVGVVRPLSSGDESGFLLL